MSTRRAERTELTTRTLVEAMVREDGTVAATELYPVAAALGMSDQQVRLCVKRLVAEGRFVQQGRGRGAVLRAAGASGHALDPDVEFVRLMYAQDRGEAPWDGVWHLVTFAVPESARAARDALRDTVVGLGGALLQGGVYVSAHPWEELVAAEAARLDVADRVTTLTTTDLRVGDVAEPRALAARLWPLPELARAHDQLADLAAGWLDRLTEPARVGRAELLTIAIELAAEFTRATEPDPLLPPELLPRPWPGARARELVARCWARLRDHPAADPTPGLFRRYAEVIGEVVTHLPDPR
ncbi:PaaX family transcriptional regulator C-terminal domain-containing protein [Streptoalloteichus hindustanus]|uniref:Transcriptional regulator, PaaX family n=1 Tax=Streptoalloteichus hindustanus TaxID=2017 RepID=A0A1M5DLW2_STRHI|nr:PaaX family transcriptional regulator C-terminal domain-containing protein [Streptoalloteichus hindustanus]SHF67896.1 transcriptional regulator, PaaX family [Streptoalloteichus hindustanus]